MRKEYSRWSVLFLVIAGSMLLGGCAGIYRPTGVVLTHYAQDEVVPYALTTTDTNLTTCGTGLGLQQLLASFGRVIDRPHRDVMAAELLSAYCSEAHAYSAHLRYLRALNAGNASAARDARIVSQRAQKVTALRRLAAYHDFVAAYGKLGTSECPDFEYPIDAAQYLAGLLTSVQALLSDIRSGGVVGVPQDVALKSARSSQCLDNRKWWGVPLALRAVVWTSVPGSAPEGTNPSDAFQRAAAIGTEKGMPLAAAFWALGAYNQGNTQAEKQAISEFARIMDANNVPEDYAFLAGVGRVETLQLSDQIWTKKTGHRTPTGKLGTFPGEQSQNGSNGVNVNQFL